MNIDNFIGDLVKSIGPEAVANQLMSEPVGKFLNVLNYLESETSERVIPEIMHHKDLKKFVEGQGDECSIIATLVQMVSPGLQVEVLRQLSKHPCQDETSVLKQVYYLSPENQANALLEMLQEPGNRLANLIATDDSQGQMLKTLIEAFTTQPQNSNVGVVVRHDGGLTDALNEGLSFLKKQEDQIKEQMRRQTTLSNQVVPTQIKMEPATPLQTTSSTNTFTNNLQNPSNIARDCGIAALCSQSVRPCLCQP